MADTEILLRFAEEKQAIMEGAKAGNLDENRAQALLEESLTHYNETTPDHEKESLLSCISEMAMLASRKNTSGAFHKNIRDALDDKHKSLRGHDNGDAIEAIKTVVDLVLKN